MKIDEEMDQKVRKLAEDCWKMAPSSADIKHFYLLGYRGDTTEADALEMFCAGYRMALNDVEKAMEQVLKGGLGE